MLDDITARIAHYENLARLATDDEERLARIVATLEDIRAEAAKMVALTERLQATLKGER